MGGAIGVQSAQILLHGDMGNAGFFVCVAHGSKPVTFPDFTRGQWKKTPPFPIYGA